MAEDIQEELGHAQRFAERIKELWGVVPGSQEFEPEQSYLQPPEHQTDVVHVIRGVIEAEAGAIDHYNRIIEASEGVDPVTQDMVTEILHDEEGTGACSRASCASTRPRASLEFLDPAFVVCRRMRRARRPSQAGSTVSDAI